MKKTKKTKDRSVVPMSDFGKDHWSTFAYIETRIVDHQGEPDRRHMRCDKSRHPFYDHGHDASAYPTRIRDGEIKNHDDWDCLHDCIAAGLLEDVGTTVCPRFRLTKRGVQVASALRQHKSRGGNFAGFVVGARSPSRRRAVCRGPLA